MMETDAGISRSKGAARVSNFQQDTDSGKPLSLGTKGKPYDSQPEKEDEFHSYPMRGKRMGKALIINMEKYKNMNDRKGTDRDKRRMKTALSNLGFEVEVKEDLSSKEIKVAIDKVATADHSSYSCFVCVFLAHGDDGVIFGRDGSNADSSTHVRLKDDVFDKFRGDRCKSLTGKPKIFIIQACRGEAYEEPVVEFEFDSSATTTDSVPLSHVGEGTKPTIPSGADFLICYSTSQGFYSFRNSENGSWYISTLCEQLRNYGREEFTKILTRVHHQVSLRESQTSFPETTGKKQMPCFVSMLTKQLFLQPA